MGGRSTDLGHSPLARLNRAVTVRRGADADALVLRGGQHLVLGDELPAVGKGVGLHPVRLPRSSGRIGGRPGDLTTALMVSAKAE